LIVVTTAAVTGVLAVTQHAQGGSKQLRAPAAHRRHAGEAGYTRWHAHEGRSFRRPPPGRGS
jgi:hypothetical protein